MRHFINKLVLSILSLHIVDCDLCHLLKYYVLCDDFSCQALEPVVHGQGRKADLQDMYFGVHEELLYARKIKPVEGIV